MSAVEHGADAIGLIFYPPSPRAVTLGQAQGIVAGLPESVTVVAVLVNPDLALVEAVLELGIVDCLQFHGEESAAFCEQFDTPYMKAIRVQEGMNLVSKTSEYTKTIGIKPEQMAYIDKHRGKKSKAGFLDLIINKHKNI